MGSIADWASVSVTLLLGIAGFVVARNIGRDVRLKVTERRLVAYERLWALMRTASPYNPPMDEAARRSLHGEFTDWYYENGDGMLLERASRTVYLEAKDNLIRPVERLTPVESRNRLRTLADDQLETERGILAQRQLSLLRTQLKSDLAIYGRPYNPTLGPEDRAFLTHCGVNLAHKPWSKSPKAIEKEMERDGSDVSGVTSLVNAQE
jgi:hypothetical protein